MVSLAVFAEPRSARWRVGARPAELQVSPEARAALLHHARMLPRFSGDLGALSIVQLHSLCSQGLDL
eukprot:11863846-Alexandrium_andersonii.AAC.1